MSNSDQDSESNSFDDPRYWTVQPGSAMGLFELGTPRDEVVALLKKLDLEHDLDEEDDSNEAFLYEMEMTLYFAAAAPHPLLLIEADDDRTRFGTLKVIGDFPHNILNLMQIPETETLWCDDISQILDPEHSPQPPKHRADAEMLRKGTLWITSLGLGFRLSNGVIATVYLCDPAQAPRVGDGGFTSDQRHLSERMQLDSFRATDVQRSPVRKLASGVLLLIAAATIGYFGNEAFQLQQKWNNATEVEGEVIAVWPPDHPLPDKFTVRYVDAAGKEHQVEWGVLDICVTRKVGETFTLRYLPDDPSIALGPCRLNDVAFNTLFPYLIGTFFTLVVAHFTLDFFLRRI